MTVAGRHRHSVEGGYARGEETRARIVTAALRLFGQRGFDGASTRDIATAAAVNAPALQYYFDNKEGVSPFLMHRLAKRTIAHLRSVGVEHLYAECSDSILGAEKWLRRLGFVRDGKSWRCDLSI